MEKIPLPNKIEVITTDNPNRVLVVVEPCYEGYGTTLGNALRRVLLSSMPGAAVTAIKIKNVQHEFSAIPNVKEDVIELILNFKQLRMKIYSNEDIKMKIAVKGEKEVTAADIEHGPEVEIINPDLHIATLTDKKADLEIEITANIGRGYVPTEARDKEKLEIGTIAIDSIYTPLKNVGFKIENVRVGRMTNFERLTYDIETDGTITPKDAVTQSANILMEHLAMLTEEGLAAANRAKEEMLKRFEEEKKKEEEEKEKIVTEEKEAPPVEAVEEEKPKRKRGRPRKTEVTG